MGQSYLNLVPDKEVSIGIEQLLIGYTTVFSTLVWTPGKILDPINNPPNGFYHLGTVVEDSVTLNIVREKFSYSAGIPKNLQYEAVMGITGTIEASLIGRRGTLAYFGLGNHPQALDTVLRVFNCSSVLIPSEKYFVTSSTDSDALTPGLLIFHGLVAQTVSSSNNLAYGNVKDAYIGDASTATSSPWGVTVVFTPRFWNPNSAPLIGSVMTMTSMQRNPLGTGKIDTFHVLGVADFIDGVQVVHDFPEMTAVGEWVEEIKPDQEPRIPLKFEARGQVVQTYDNSVSHLSIGERFWFSENT